MDGGPQVAGLLQHGILARDVGDHGNHGVHGRLQHFTHGYLSLDVAFLRPQPHDFLFVFDFLPLCVSLELVVIDELEFIGLLLQLVDLIPVAVDDAIGLDILLVDGVQLLVLLVEDVVVVVLVSFEVAPYLVHVLVLYDVFLEEHLRDVLGELELLADYSRCLVAQEVVHHVDLFDYLVFADVLEDQTAQVVLYVAVPHLDLIYVASLEHDGHMLRDLLVHYPVPGQVDDLQGFRILYPVEDVDVALLRKIAIHCGEDSQMV